MRNAKVPKGRFVLSERVNISGEQPIYLRYYFNNYVKRSTGVSVKKEDWDDNAQRVVSQGKLTDWFNSKLLHMKEETDERIYNYILSGKPMSYEVLVSLVDNVSVDELPIRSRVDFFEYARKINQMQYDAGRMGYTTFYNKSRYIDAFEFYVKSHCGIKKLMMDEVDRDLFDSYIDYRINTLNNKSRDGINKTLNPLYDAVRRAGREELIPSSLSGDITDNYLPVKDVLYNPDNNAEDKVRYLTLEQMKALHDYCNGLERRSAIDAADLFFFSFYACGMRISDLITLEWRNIDFKNKHINKIQVKTKKRPDVLIPLSDEAIAILERWKGRNARFVFDKLPEDFDFSNQRLFLTKKNSATRMANMSLLTISRNAKMPIVVTMHVARHSFAVMAINNGISLFMLSKLLGHSSITATEKVYAQFLKEKVDGDVSKLMSVKF